MRTRVTAALTLWRQMYYGKKNFKKYWLGCSSGGKQGLKEAQFFPEDYDGILAGAAA